MKRIIKVIRLQRSGIDTIKYHTKPFYTFQNNFKFLLVHFFILKKKCFKCFFWNAPSDKTEIHTHVTLGDFTSHSDMGKNLINILNACLSSKCIIAGVKIIVKYDRVYDPLHPCLSIILQLSILTKILVNLIQSHSISILPSKYIPRRKYILRNHDQLNLLI